ncbi:MAG TPA: TetR family transcriptional regulator C-terminal domain-containing protein [Euzebyales bacterium]|nr:TetR family transcriptional regulator C-terminal domain-containing protein [Euzebyales bacterium]
MATRTRLTRAERKARTHAELVEAARQVFLERGYQAATVEAVAAAAGFSTGAVYSSVGGKAGLFLAVFDARVDDRARQMEQVGARARSVGELAELLAREYATTTAQQRAWSVLVIEFWALAAREPELRREFAARHDRLKAATARVIDQVVARTGERLALATDQVATAAAALANGLTLEHLAHPEAPGDDLLATLASLIMRGLTRDAAPDASR